MQAQRYSGLFLAHDKHSLSVKSQFLRRELSNFHHLYCRVVLRSLILLIYRFKRDDFLSENGIFACKTFTQYGQNSYLTSEHTVLWLCDVRPVQRLGPLPHDIHAEDI